MPVIRYAGSKAKTAKQIVETFPEEFWFYPGVGTSSLEFREPFFGSGAIGFEVMKHLNPRTSKVWINDLDYGICCLWKSVRDMPKALCEWIEGFKPSLKKFERFKRLDGSDKCPELISGFRKIALHQTSFGGYGYKGGPQGGTAQESEFKLGCRWNASSLIRQVHKLHKLMKPFGDNLRITCLDYSKLIEAAPEAEQCFFYLDPPYVGEGPKLYRHSLTEADHRTLARAAQGLASPWVMSYDDHPLVRELYEGCLIRDLEVTYTGPTSKKKRDKKKEVIISPRDWRKEPLR